MPLFGRGGEEAEQAGGANPDSAWADALGRYRTMPVAERAASVLATIAPAIAEKFDNANWKAGVGPSHTDGDSLLDLLIPQTTRPDKLSPEQWRAMYELRITLAEALNALVIARLVINFDYGSGVVGIRYAVSPDGLAALERGDVAEVVARRLPD
jgi:hypothetical protein